MIITRFNTIHFRLGFLKRNGFFQGPNNAALNAERAQQKARVLAISVIYYNKNIYYIPHTHQQEKTTRNDDT